MTSNINAAPYFICKFKRNKFQKYILHNDLPIHVQTNAHCVYSLFKTEKFIYTIPFKDDAVSPQLFSNKKFHLSTIKSNDRDARRLGIDSDYVYKMFIFHFVYVWQIKNVNDFTFDESLNLISNIHITNSTFL